MSSCSTRFLCILLPLVTFICYRGTFGADPTAAPILFVLSWPPETMKKGSDRDGFLDESNYTMYTFGRMGGKNMCLQKLVSCTLETLAYLPLVGVD